MSEPLTPESEALHRRIHPPVPTIEGPTCHDPGWECDILDDLRGAEAAAAQRAVKERAACKSCGKPREVHVMPCPRCTVNVYIEIDDDDAALTATTAQEGE